MLGSQLNDKLSNLVLRELSLVKLRQADKFSHLVRFSIYITFLSRQEISEMLISPSLGMAPILRCANSVTVLYSRVSRHHTDNYSSIITPKVISNSYCTEHLLNRLSASVQFIQCEKNVSPVCRYRGYASRLKDYHSEKLRVEYTPPELKYPPWVRSETVPPQGWYEAYTKFKSISALAVRQVNPARNSIPVRRTVSHLKNMSDANPVPTFQRFTSRHPTDGTSGAGTWTASSKADQPQGAGPPRPWHRNGNPLGPGALRHPWK